MATHYIVGELVEHSKSMTESENLKMNPLALDPNLMRPPERYVYVFTVSKRAFLIERPPLFPKFEIRACPPGERYCKITKIPDPFQQPVRNLDNGRIRAEGHDGIRVTMDLINPSNLTKDQDWVCPPVLQDSIGNNLTQQGVFWSLNEVPTEAEIAKAEQRLANYQRKLIQEAREVEASRPQDLFTLITPDHHLAADAFGEQFSWHKASSTMMDCPNCGDKIKTGLKFHRMPDGKVCPLDREWCIENDLIKRVGRPPAA